MKRWMVFAAVTLLAAVLAACGQQPAATAADTTGAAPASAEAGGMDSADPASGAASASEMSMESAPGAASEMNMESAPGAASGAAGASEAGGMDHGAMGSPDADAPYDARFIDGMIMHHQGAISMAEQALEESERPEIRELAQSIISAQQDEIGRMQGWRGDWYAGLAPTGGLGMDMGDMGVGDDASLPFDQRFITAMIAHHQGAIEMAKDAQQNAEHTEISGLAGEIITAQEAEIGRMEQWQRDWFGK